MGDPISPYLTKKLNLNYESSTVAIQEAIKAGDKKKGVTPFRAKDSSSSRNAALRSLLFYSPAQAITENMKSLITHSDKVTQRLAYYHLNTQKVPLQDREAALKSFQTEMGEKSVARRLHCLRTFSHLVAPDSPTAREIVKFSQEIMEPPQAASKKDAKKAAGKDLVTRQILQSSALLALRQLDLPQFPPAMLPNLIALIESGEYPVSVRHALALIKQYAQNEKDQNQIAEMMRRFLPNSPPAQSIPKSRLAEDAQARVYMVQLFALFAETQSNNGLDVDYYEGLSHMVWDLSPRVAFEAIHGLARLGWSRMHNHRVGVRENIEYLHAVEETETAKRLLFRLIGELKDHLTKSRKSQCIVHATLRAIIVVGQTYVSSPEAQHDEVNPLNPLFGPLKAHLANCQDNIRLQILTAFVWITQYYNESLISNILENQMQQDNLTPAMYESLLTSLHQRVLVTPNMSSMALRLVHIIGTRRPDKAPAMPMAQLWNSIIRVAPGGREMVQQSLFHMLDHHRSVDDHLAMQEVHRLCYYVLGREALRITTRENKATMSSAYLRSIILRLEHAAANDSWEVRNICLDGLIKMAVGTTANDVRQQILSFFQSFPDSWSIFQKEASLVLGDVVDFHNRWDEVRLKNDNQQLSKEQKKQRDAEGAQLVKMISFFAQEEIVLFDDDE